MSTLCSAHAVAIVIGEGATTLSSSRIIEPAGVEATTTRHGPSPTSGGPSLGGGGGFSASLSGSTAGCAAGFSTSATCGCSTGWASTGTGAAVACALFGLL